MALLPAKGQGWAEEVVRESWSPVYGQKAPMTTLTFTADEVLPVEFATLLVPLGEARATTSSFARVDDGPEVASVREYKYSAENFECSFFFGDRGKVWNKDGVSSDAGFVCCKRYAGSLELILCGGSYAEVRGGASLRCTRPVLWAELNVRNGERTVFSSDLDAVDERAVEPSETTAPGSQ